MVHCAYHPKREAVGACVECGKLVCASCHTEHDGKIYCKPCAQKLFALESTTSAVTKAAAASPIRPKTPRVSKTKPSKAVESKELQTTIKKEKPETAAAKTPSESRKKAVKEPAAAVSQAPSPRKVSNLWWLAPVFIAWLGGLIAWGVNKKANPRKSKHMLFGGIGMTFVQLLMVFLIIFAAGAPSSKIPVVTLESVGPTDLNVPANTTWTAKITKEKGATIQAEGMSIKVPSGAVKSDTEIVVKEFIELPPEYYYAETSEPPPMALAVGNVYDFGPAGIQFDKPAQVTLSYDKTLLPTDAETKDITMVHWDGKNWIVVGGYVDAKKGTVTVSAAGFPGSPVGLIIGGGVLIGSLILYLKKAGGDPRTKGTTPQHVMPKNDTVKANREKAGIPKAKGKWTPLEDPQRPGKLNPEVMTDTGFKRIGFKDKGAKAAGYPDYQEIVAGKDLNWTKPDDWFKNNMKGDCTSVSSAMLSMLRGLGVEAYGVDGEKKNNGKWGEHAWVEFVYKGKPYYYDDNEGIKPLEDVKKDLSVPYYTLGSKGYMWNENGQKTYKAEWWKDFAQVPSVSIKTPGSTGIINQPYTFVAEPENIPTGAKIEWSFSGGPDESGAFSPDTETVTHTFKSLGEKTISIRYTQGNVKVAGDEVKFLVEGAPSLDVQLPAPASTAGLPLNYDEPNTFTAIPKNIPPDAVYTWYIGKTKVDEGANKTTATVPANSFTPGAEYDVLVSASWTGGDEKNIFLTASKTFRVAEAPRLYIQLPASPGTPLNPEKPNSFIAAPTNIPLNAVYTWYLDGAQVRQGVNATTGTAPANSLKPGAQYQIGVIATWIGNDKTQKSVQARESFIVGGATPPPAAPPGAPPGAPPPTETAKGEVSFIVYRFTANLPGETPKYIEQYCQNFHVQILRDGNVIDGGDSAARNGAFEIILPVGQYRYSIGGSYPDKTFLETGSFTVREGSGNYVEVITEGSR